ncbi:hypothetical protein SAMN05216516_11323 [Izhakiella capsodis]|uniref:Uncharacterized protein n=1 Tax=Izhakiella capsodis TaxID=1367852 RepID=A0A1I5ATU2_9GAMM|nr:hypothetical protein SAMN05216516_11323 [Izhakiella capsodis]
MERPLLKRSLIGAGILSALGVTVSKYSTTRSTPTGAGADSPSSPSAPAALVEIDDDNGVSPERLPERDVSYGDYPKEVGRHRRHLLSRSPYNRKAHEESHVKTHLHRADERVNRLLYREGITENEIIAP